MWEGRCRLEREGHGRADPRHVVHGERRADGEPLVDGPVTEGVQKRSREINTDPSCLDQGRLLPEDVGSRVEEPRREVHVVDGLAGGAWS